MAGPNRSLDLVCPMGVQTFPPRNLFARRILGFVFLPEAEFVNWISWRGARTKFLLWPRRVGMKHSVTLFKETLHPLDWSWRSVSVSVPVGCRLLTQVRGTMAASSLCLTMCRTMCRSQSELQTMCWRGSDTVDPVHILEFIIHNPKLAEPCKGSAHASCRSSRLSKFRFQFVLRPAMLAHFDGSQCGHAR